LSYGLEAAKSDLIAVLGQREFAGPHTVMVTVTVTRQPSSPTTTYYNRALIAEVRFTGIYHKGATNIPYKLSIGCLLKPFLYCVSDFHFPFQLSSESVKVDS